MPARGALGKVRSASGSDSRPFPLRAGEESGGADMRFPFGQSIPAAGESVPPTPQERESFLYPSQPSTH